VLQYYAFMRFPRALQYDFIRSCTGVNGLRARSERSRRLRDAFSAAMELQGGPDDRYD
jgi:hypothetical protein